jgi:hypothetical protein
MKKIQNQNLLVKMIDLNKQYVTYVDVKSYYSKILLIILSLEKKIT